MVEAAEQFGAGLITVEVNGRRAAVREDDKDAAYQAATTVQAICRTVTSQGRGVSLRTLIEVQVRYGGIAPRALLGGVFEVGTGDAFLLEVAVGGTFETLTQGQGLLPRTCSSVFWSRPLIVGLPQEFAAAVLSGLSDSSWPVKLPPGKLQVDRAGFDERESGAPVFELAGRLLRCVLEERFDDGDIEPKVRSILTAR